MTSRAAHDTVEDVYPLTPMQRGMLYHTLREPGSGVYVEQIRLTLEGLDADLFRRCWERMLERHAALRTSLAGLASERPAQVVRRRVELPWSERDLRPLESEAARQEWLQRFLDEDARAGFALDEPCLMRCHLLRTGDDRHEFVWTLHHIALDGWSGGLVLAELLRCYRAGGRLELAPPRPFRDHVAWLQGQDLAAAASYWRDALTDAPLLTLPDDRGPAADEGAPPQGSGHARHERRLDTDRLAALRRRAAGARVTLNTLVQAAWALVLGRAAGSDDVVLGTVSSGRPEALAGVESMVGMFVNTLPLRVLLDPGADVDAWLADVQARHTRQRDVEHSPLWEIQRWAGRDAGRPLFETLLVVENYPVDPALLHGDDGLSVRLTAPFDRTGYPLMLLVTPGTDLALQLTHDRTRFSDSAARRLLDQVAATLEALAGPPPGSVGELAPPDDAQRRRVLVEWNRTATDVPEVSGLHQLVQRQAARTPDATAILDPGRPADGVPRRVLDYAELLSAAHRLAHHLRALGVDRDRPVGVCLERSPEMIVAVLGVLAAGGAYLPLDPRHPAERLRQLIDDAGLEVVVVHGATREAFAAAVGGPALVCLQRDATELAARPDTAPPFEASADDLAYVLYTSGSTGRPKGVAMPHRPLLNLMHWQAGQSGDGTGVTTLQFAPLIFDVSCQELFATLGTGGTLCLVDEDTRRDPAALLGLLEREGVGRLFMPFVALDQLVAEAVGGGPLPTSLREVITAGEQLVVSPDLVAFFEALPDCRLVNQYGPTECHVVSAHTLEGPPASWPRHPAIGRPIANTRLYVRDAAGQPCPVGVPGELCVGGVALARGYLGDAQRTAASFVPDPFGAPGDRLYRTGDRARWLDDGTLECLGRDDDQVKLRGVRVELGEVEAAARQLPGVRQALAAVREERPGDRRLVLALVLDDDAPGLDVLREGLAARLPAECVPAGLLPVERLPTTASGKVDRQALAAAEAAAPVELRRAHVPPRGPLEQLLAELWSEVLGVRAPGVHDDFFDLGGHSLTATRLASRIRDALRVELPLRWIFEQPTIAGLAGRLAAQEPGHVERGPLRTGAPVEGDLPLSFSQQRLWFLDQIGTDAAYNMPWAFRLRGSLDADALERALAAVVARHDSLRTRFLSRDGRPVRRVVPGLIIPLRRVDLSALDAASRDAELERLAAAEAETPFDLERGPLLRPSLVRLSADEHALFLSLHHIVFDGWSIGVLNRELLAHYRAERDGVPAAVPALQVSYGDFVAWQAGWLRGELLERQLAYWLDKLGGDLPVLELPVDRARPEHQTYRGAGHRLLLEPGATAALARLARRQGVTLAVTVLAGFKLLLARTTGLEDILVGTPVANRTERRTEDLIGFFVNTLVLRSDLSGDPTFVELLERVHTTALEAYEHQDLPFERLVDELQPVRDPSRNPIFQVVFAMQNASREPLALPDLEVTPLGAATRATRFDLELHVGETPAGLDLGLCYNRDLFDAATIERLGRHLVQLLRAVVAEPTAPLSRVPMLLDDERRLLLEEWNDTSVRFPVERCLHERFAAQAAARPEATALTCDGQAMSYGELERRANQLAHALGERGVGPGVLVGLCLERGPELVVGLLGVLKAGGCYVPLDLANPAERIAFILDDAAVSVMVCDAAAAARLPAHDAPRLRLDADRALLDAAPTTAPVTSCTPDDPAYVIYTSGSTGTPKGVVVEHRSALRLFAATEGLCGFGPDDVWTLFHSSAFDFSVWEIWGALLHGGRLVVVPYMVSRAPEEFLALLAAERVTVLNQTPSAFRSLIAADGRVAPPAELALRLVIFGGEALEPAMLAPWVERRGDEQPQLVNMYGITETTVHVTWRRLRAADLASVPGSVIGRPLPDLSLYVLDRHGELAPVGVPGELYVGGAGVSRGYLRRPELTAERFLPDPFRSDPGARLYRTGDVGRYLTNGEVQYLGRNDEQVQLRGYRIELGEIEAALGAHEWVGASVVTLQRGGEADEPRLVAYVVPEAAETEADASQLVSQWESLYDDTYSGAAPEAEPDFHIVGWNSSYTQQPLPAAEMREWVDETVDWILAEEPGRVLEIGCGTGLLLFRVAPRASRYLGTDLSRAAIDYVGAHLDDALRPRVELAQAMAHALPPIEPRSFDTVVLNSVIQYFPGTNYLAAVLERAVDALADGGRVLIGDVRHLGLLEAYHASVQLHQADRELPIAQLVGRVRQRLAQEEELVVDPAFFVELGARLARVTRVAITPKRAAARNELSDFRYQVTLHVGEPADSAGVTGDASGDGQAAQVVEGDATSDAATADGALARDAAPASDDPWRDACDDDLDPDALAAWLTSAAPAQLGLAGVPNARTLRHVAAARALLHPEADTAALGTPGRLRARLARDEGRCGVDPARLVALERRLPYRVDLDWSRGLPDGAFDVLFTRRDSGRAPRFPPVAASGRPWQDHGNQPLQARLTRQLAPRLREWLEQRVPAYMVPSAFVMLAGLPLTANGKVDRAALPDPDWFLSVSEGDGEAPRGATEERLAAIWAELLGLDRVGSQDDFFDLGGHSLLAAQVVSRVREAFAVELGLRQLFDCPTVQELARCVDELLGAGGDPPGDRETGEL